MAKKTIEIDSLSSGGQASPSSKGLVSPCPQEVDAGHLPGVLRKGEEEYRCLFEHMREGFAYCRVLYENGSPRDFVYLTVNDAFEKLTGLKSVGGKKVSEIIPGVRQSNPELLEIYGRVAMGGGPERFETHLEPLGIWLSGTVYSPRREYFVTVFENITERKRTELALRESKRRVEVLARAVSMLLAAPEPQKVLEQLCNEVRCCLECDVFFNFLLDRGTQRLKLNACGGVDERVGRMVEGLALAESLCGSAAETAGRVVLTNIDRSDDPRAAVVKRLGVRAYAAHPLMGAAGEVMGTLSFGTRGRGSFSAEDLELMKTVADHVAVAMLRSRGEAALAAANQRLSYHVQNTPLGVIDFDADLRVTAWGDGARRIFGWTAAEVMGLSMWEIPWICEEDRVKVRTVSAGLTSGETIRSVSPNRNLRKDGKVIWCEWYNSSLTDASGKMQSIQSLVLDVTARQEAEAVLARDKEDLERLVAERTAKLKDLVAELEHFSYSITHDMRAPLRGMQGFAEAMTEALENGDKTEAQGFLRRIRTSATRMDLLITDALQYAKAVRQELPLAPVEVGSLLRGILDSYPEFQSERAHIEVMPEIPSVIGNEAGLTQVFSNLLGNAVKFVKPGNKPEIRVWAEVLEKGLPTGSNRWVRMWVVDEGIGIPDSMKAKVFDMFARGNNSYEGTGIGLALVRKVVQRMGGRVGVESEEGKGSRFWVELKDGSSE